MKKKSKQDHYSPHKLAEKLLKFLLPGYSDYSVIGDYEEIYNRLAQQHGLFRAKLWYWNQIIKSAIPHTLNSIKWRIYMFKNYLRITLRNILKKKLHSLINITGLAIGLACCVLIMMWVQDELSFDRFHHNSEDLYAATFSNGSPITPTALAGTLKKDYPEVVNTTRFYTGGHPKFTYKDKTFFEGRSTWVDPSFFKMFTIQFIDGDAAAVFSDPNSIIITQTFAQKYFGTQNPMGEILKFNDRIPLKVTGLVKDYPSNSHIRFNYILPFILLKKWGVDLNSWESNWLRTYVQLQKGTLPYAFDQKIKNLVQSHREQDRRTLQLQIITRLHLNPIKGTGTMVYVYIFSALALFILLLACINFMNLTTASSIPRAKEVGMRRVMGAQKSDLRYQFFGESMFLTIMALMVALLLIFLLLPGFNQLSGKSFSLSTMISVPMILGILFTTLISGMISGSYPSLFLSSFNPINVLRGIFPTGKGGSTFKKALVLFQFSISISLLIGTLVVYQQIHYMKNRPVGYNQDHIVHLFMRSRFSDTEFETLRQQLKQYSGIQKVTITSNAPYHRETDYGEGDVRWEGQGANQATEMHVMAVDADFLDTFKMKLKSGRFFSKELPTDKKDAFVLNESAVSAMGLRDPIGKRLWVKDHKGIIIGVVKDFHFRSMHRFIEPLAMKIIPQWCDEMCIRINPMDVSGSLGYLEGVWKKLYPGYPFQYWFLDDTLASLYGAEERVGRTSQYFTILAVIISCLGLLGLVSFTAEQRTKEIGIRKTLGASSFSIVKLLASDYLKWILLANIIAWPITFIAMNKWLQNFAYHITLKPPIFILCGTLALAAALLTVSYRSIKAASTNPVDTLKHE
jgi:ABC-type antimicrobial peptide transport system permease subunit